MGGVHLRCVHHGHLLGGKRTLGLIHRKKARPDKAGGASSLLTQQWRLLPSSLPSVLLPMGRRVLKCHREGKGGYPNAKMRLLLCLYTRWVFYQLAHARLLGYPRSH